MKTRNFVGDLRVCIKRFYVCENLIKDWLNNAGRGKMEIFTYLNLNGDESLDLPKHPYQDYKTEEKKVFRQCFGKPLTIPKNLNIEVSVKKFLEKVAKRRDLMRECAGWTRNSRFKGMPRNFNRSRKPRKRSFKK